MSIVVLRSLSVPLLPRHFLTLRGRIHDGKGGGVAFSRGSKGLVEGCKIWRNAGVGVTIQGNNSEVVVAGCKCADGRAGEVLASLLISDSANP